MEFPMVLLT